MSTAAILNRISKLLLLASLAACGAPGSDTVFLQGNPKAGVRDSARAVVAMPPQPRIQPKLYRGHYRRLNDESRFRPCGTRIPLDVTGTPEARFRLHERFRFNAVWQGRAMFGVFYGAIVTDTLTPKGPAASDSGAVTTVTRFFITGVDSLRTWHADDCGGMRVN